VIEDALVIKSVLDAAYIFVMASMNGPVNILLDIDRTSYFDRETIFCASLFHTI
jgi:hypothetical protein